MATFFGDSSDNLFRGTSGADDITGAGGDDLALGKAGADHITGDAGDDILIGDEGSDMLFGGTGADIMFGGLYNEATETFTDDGELDQLFGDSGNDSILVGDKDVVLAGAGNDVLEILDLATPLTKITIDGGDGLDVVNLAPYRLKSVVYLDQGVAGSDIHMTNVEGLVLGDGGSQVFGGAFADYVQGGAGIDVLSGAGGNDEFHAGGGDDRLTGGAGNDKLDGGDGKDTAIYAGLSRAYTVSLSNGSGSVSSAGEGVDSLTSIERVQFVDGYLATGTTDPAAQVYRVYQAALGRAPDPQGLAGWSHALEKGASLKTIANGFLDSPEFVARFGAGDNTAFVNLLYQNVLGRPGDAEGRQAWVAQLDKGASRADVLTGFSESPEFTRSTSGAVQHGLWVGDADAAKVARLYDTVFDRRPDASGEAGWTAKLQAGESLQTVANGFVASQEFRATYGALDDTRFVQTLYQNVLGRPGEQAGVDSWVHSLATGHSRAEVVVGFSESAEHVALTAPYIDNGVWFG